MTALRRLFTLRPRDALLAAGGLLLLAEAASAQRLKVATPPGWYSGDTHVHMQQCDTWVDLTMPEIDTQMQATGLDVVAIQLWCSRWTPPDYYLSHYASMVTGEEDPISTPQRKLQVGVEVSGLAASQFGHVTILEATDGFFPWDALYPGPILDFYDDALTGYAHVSWFEHYDPVPIYGGLNGAYLAPIDAALGAIDFVETTRVEPDPQLPGLNWRGLYYKLLNAGLRVSLVAGSDNSCFTQEIGDQRTYAQLETGPLSFARWVEAIEAGRTTVSAGPHRFLDLDVEGTGIGGQLSLAEPGQLSVTATLSVTHGASDTGWLHILKDGRDVARMPYSLPSGGKTTLQAMVPIEESGWLSARCAPGAHTAATYVYVADRPIARAEDATYWIEYCDLLAAHIGDYNVPEVESAILQRIATARKLYTALLGTTLPDPEGVASYGLSSPACEGPITIGVTSENGETTALSCVNAPPRASGLLVLGVKAEESGLTIHGCTPLIAQDAPFITLPVTANAAGFIEVPNPLPPGKAFRAQFVWLNPPECDLGGRLCSSNATAVGQP